MGALCGKANVLEVFSETSLLKNIVGYIQATSFTIITELSLVCETCFFEVSLYFIQCFLLKSFPCLFHLSFSVC